MNTPKPGVLYDVPDAEYRAWPYPSQSVLSMFRDRRNCELDIKDYIESGQDDTPAMRLGRLFESAVDGLPLDPNVRVLPPEIKARRGAAWDALRNANPEVEWLPPSEFAKHNEVLNQARSMAASVHEYLPAAVLLRGAKRQVSFIWDATFENEQAEKVTHRIKGRLDYLNLDPKINAIIDLKAMSACGPWDVGRDMWSRAFDVQVATYSDAMRDLLKNDSLKFYFIVCNMQARNVKPDKDGLLRHVVTVYNGQNNTNAAGEFHSIGTRAYQIYLSRLAHCQRTGIWRGYFEESAPDGKIIDVHMPAWAS